MDGWTLPPELLGAVATVGGGPARVLEDLTPPWGAATRSVLVTCGSPESKAVVQWVATAEGGGAASADRAAMRRRLRLGRELPRRAPRLPLPQVMAGDGAARVPFLVTRYVAGSSGREWLGDDARATQLGTAVGRLLREVARVPAGGLRLSQTWADRGRLAAAGERGLATSRPELGGAEAAAIRSTIARLPAVFVGTRPVLAHGDLAPVNVLMRDGQVAALLDLERTRLAHPLFDAAWWRWILCYHHPERAEAAVGSFLASAGVPGDAVTGAALDALATLQCLEVLAATPRREAVTRREWAARIAAALGSG